LCVFLSDMPFHGPRHQHSLSESSPTYDNFYSTTNALHASGQSLASVGLPLPNQWPPASHKPPAVLPPPNQLQTQQYQPLHSNGNNGMTIPYRAAPQGHHPGPVAYNTDAQNQAQFQTPQRSNTLRRNEELHLPQTGSAMSDIQHYGAPPTYNVNVQPATPQHPPSQPVPGQLQPGQSNRPPMMASSNTAPQLPTLPQISTQMQQQQSPSSARPSALSTTHSYSRSSPGLMEQPKYKPFSSTPDKYNTPNSYGPQTPSGPPSYSPLGLADIRTRTEAGFSDPLFSPTQTTETEVMHYPTTSGYIAPWPIYALDWCKWPPRTANSAGKVALGSYSEDGQNWLQVLDAQMSSTGDEPSLEFTKTAEATHAYPVTRILWEPPSSNKQTTDLLATSGDHLRLWSLPSDAAQSYQSNSIGRKDQPLQKLSPLALLSNSKSPEHTAPITSLDWNVVQPSLIITSSIDTTCTIWDIPTLTAKTQLIAHDKEVYDVRFCANSVDVFVSCGADGSVRMFDLRSLEHSTIIYEPSEKPDKGCK
jgi:DDB1- and CUL4-associated factor 7